MPTYCFKNKDTGEVIERFMSITARERFLQDNPQLETAISGAPMLVDSVRLGIRKPDSGFREVLKKIHTKTPGSQLDKTNHF